VIYRRIRCVQATPSPNRGSTPGVLPLTRSILTATWCGKAGFRAGQRHQTRSLVHHSKCLRCSMWYCQLKSQLGHRAPFPIRTPAGAVARRRSRSAYAGTKSYIHAACSCRQIHTSTRWGGGVWGAAGQGTTNSLMCEEALRCRAAVAVPLAATKREGRSSISHFPKKTRCAPAPGPKRLEPPPPPCSRALGTGSREEEGGAVLFIRPVSPISFNSNSDFNQKTRRHVGPPPAGSGATRINTGSG
jgi:hypothetical protein